MEAKGGVIQRERSLLSQYWHFLPPMKWFLTSVTWNRDYTEKSVYRLLKKIGHAAEAITIKIKDGLYIFFLAQ